MLFYTGQGVICNKQYDTILLRSSINNLILSSLLSFCKIKHKKLLILEVTTNSSAFVREIAKIIRKIRLILQILTLQPLLYYCTDVLVVISKQGFMEKLFRKKTLIVTNGISLRDVPLRTKIYKRETNEIHLLGVGNVSFWHEYDRIITGIAEYRKRNPDYKVFFHIVGEGEAIDHLRELTERLGLTESIIFEGIKTGDELTKLFDQCDIAVGSLGIHRKGLKESSSLKHREYCARGIPFILSDIDRDFPDKFPFVLRLPQNDEPVNISEIINWYKQLVEKYPNYSLEMRKYAEQNLTWEVKLKPLIDRISNHIRG